MKKSLFLLPLLLTLFVLPAYGAPSETDFTIEAGTLYEYTGPGGEVVVPEGVTAIGGRAFLERTDITRIVLPEGVWEISLEAFGGCTGLQEINLPSTLREIRSGAFSSCTSLERVTIPDGVERLSSSVFWGCTSLKEVILPEGMEIIDDNLFRDCTSLARLDIPKSVTWIGRNAFTGTPWLESLGDFAVVNGILAAYQGPGGDIVLPDSITSIADRAAYENQTITSVTIPKTVQEIGVESFAGCTALARVEVQEGVPELGGSTFADCTSLTQVSLPDSIREFTVYEFKGTPWLEAQGDMIIRDGVLLVYQGKGGDVVIPDGVTEIQDHVFSGNDTITGVTIPDSVHTIGMGAFNNCSSLTKVDLPSPLPELGMAAFLSTPWLESLGDFAIVDGVLLQYQGRGGDVVIPQGVERIGTGAFYWDSNVTGVVVPGSVKTIGAQAFALCDLQRIVLQEGVTRLDSEALHCGNNDFQVVVLPASLTEIAEDAFFFWDTDTYYAPAGSAAEAFLQKQDIPVQPLAGSTSGFTDVAEEDYCATAVLWAKRNGITTGTTPTTFSPDRTCTRAQIVTMLWRASGAPESSAVLPYTDVSPSDAGYPALCWAYQEGLLDDTSAFSPNAPCTRAQAVTFLWRLDAPPPGYDGTEVNFVDVPEDAAYFEAVRWAVGRGVTTGTGPETFSPYRACTRGQIVTFLYRALG